MSSWGRLLEIYSALDQYTPRKKLGVVANALRNAPAINQPGAMPWDDETLRNAELKLGPTITEAELAAHPRKHRVRLHIASAFDEKKLTKEKVKSSEIVDKLALLCESNPAVTRSDYTVNFPELMKWFDQTIRSITLNRDFTQLGRLGYVLEFAFKYLYTEFGNFSREGDDLIAQEETSERAAARLARKMLSGQTKPCDMDGILCTASDVAAVRQANFLERLENNLTLFNISIDKGLNAKFLRKELLKGNDPVTHNQFYLVNELLSAQTFGLHKLHDLMSGTGDDVHNYMGVTLEGINKKILERDIVRLKGEGCFTDELAAAEAVLTKARARLASIAWNTVNADAVKTAEAAVQAVRTKHIDEVRIADKSRGILEPLQSADLKESLKPEAQPLLEQLIAATTHSLNAITTLANFYARQIDINDLKTRIHAESSPPIPPVGAVKLQFLKHLSSQPVQSRQKPQLLCGSGDYELDALIDKYLKGLQKTYFAPGEEPVSMLDEQDGYLAKVERNLRPKLKRGKELDREDVIKEASKMLRKDKPALASFAIYFQAVALQLLDPDPSAEMLHHLSRFSSPSDLERFLLKYKVPYIVRPGSEFEVAALAEEEVQIQRHNQRSLT